MNDLVAAGVAVCYLCTYARDKFCVAFDELDEAGCVERGKVVGIVGAGQLGNVAVGVLPFDSLDEMPGARECWLELAVGVAVGRAAGVVEMEMGQDHPIEFVRSDADGGEVFNERRPVLERVALTELEWRL